MGFTLLILSLLLVSTYSSDAAVLIHSKTESDLGELLSMAEAGSAPISDLNDAFRQRYPDYWIAMDQHAAEGVKYEEFKDENKLEIYDQSTAINTLKYFGISIKKLYINNDPFARDLAEISIAANEYASESVTDLKMRYLYGETFTKFKNAFNAVENFECLLFEKLKNNKTFDELFPKLRRLSLVFYIDGDYRYLDCELPHLQHLTLIVYPGTYWNFSPIEDFLRKNPQIISIESDQVRLIKKLLPNIQNLTLYDFNIDDETITFENVKYLEVKMESIKPLEQLSFPRLGSLEMNYVPTEFAEHLSLLKKYPNLKRMGFEIDELEGETAKLEQLFAELSDLVEIDLKIAGNINVGFISSLIQNHIHLKRIELKVHEMNINDIRQHFGNYWHINEFNTFDPFYKGLLMDKITDY